MPYSKCGICGDRFGAWELADHTHMTRDVRIDTKGRAWKMHAGKEVKLLRFKSIPTEEGKWYEYVRCGCCLDEALGLVVQE